MKLSNRVVFCRFMCSTEKVYTSLENLLFTKNLLYILQKKLGKLTDYCHVGKIFINFKIQKIKISKNKNYN